MDGWKAFGRLAMKLSGNFDINIEINANLLFEAIKYAYFGLALAFIIQMLI